MKPSTGDAVMAGAQNPVEEEPQRRVAKIKFGVHISDGGDGSVGVTLYSTETLAAQALDQEFKQCGQAFMDGGATSGSIEIDLDTGEIISGVETEVEEYEY